VPPSGDVTTGGGDGGADGTRRQRRWRDAAVVAAAAAFGDGIAAAVAAFSAVRVCGTCDGDGGRSRGGSRGRQ